MGGVHRRGRHHVDHLVVAAPDPNPLPLYSIACAMAGYNLLFWLGQRDALAGDGNVEHNIVVQVTADLVALTLLLYFADLPRNPFLFYFVFHMIIAGMYFAGALPYFFAALSSLMVGGVRCWRSICVGSPRTHALPNFGFRKTPSPTDSIC